MTLIRHESFAGALLACAAFFAPAGGAFADEPAPAPTIAPDEYERLTERLRLKNQPWAAADWEVNLTEARRRAAAEGKPVFLVVNTGNCLGFV